MAKPHDNKEILPTDSESSTDDHSQHNWDTLQNVPFSYGQQSLGHPEQLKRSPEPTPNPRQQNKIIKILLTGNMHLIDQPSVEITEDERNTFLYNTSNQRITDASFNYVISHIAGPTQNKSVDRIFNDSISSDKHLRRILSSATGLGFDKYNITDADTLKAFLERFPQPFNFDEFGEAFLENIKKYNPLSKYREYIQSMREFRLAVYGKKQEYYDQVKFLKAEATEKYPRPIETLLETATFDNSPFIYHGQEYNLTTEHLREADLSPHFELRLDGHRIGFSKPFQVGNRTACLGYVQTPDSSVVVRTYYRSNSAAVWRYLPDYVSDDNGEISWYGKAYGEESLTLPFEFQIMLNHISEGEQANINGLADFFFAGTAHRHKDKPSYRISKSRGEMPGDYYREVSSRPAYTLGPKERRPPEEIRVDERISPNFQKLLGTSTTNTGEYGQVTFRSFPSHDGKLCYIVGEDSQHRAWFSGVEDRSHLTSTGLWANWVDGRDLCTPLHEYRQQADGYGKEIGSQHYVDMWPRYLSNTPYIKEYLSTQH